MSYSILKDVLAAHDLSDYSEQEIALIEGALDTAKKEHQAILERMENNPWNTDYRAGFFYNYHTLIEGLTKELSSFQNYKDDPTMDHENHQFIGKVVTYLTEQLEKLNNPDHSECCSLHGCKIFKETSPEKCPVETGEQKQTHNCEYCADGENPAVDVIRKRDEGVHRTHCCVDHGCKYSDPTCPVVLKKIEQEYPCEFCGENEC